MHHKSSFLLISTFLLLLAAKGSHSKLMCYVCDHCSSITPGTQLETCDESFFHSGGTELPSTMTTTTEMSKETTMTPMVDTTMPMESSTTSTSTTTTTTTPTTTTMMTSTEAASETTTEMIQQNTTMTAQSTQPPVPTPPTVNTPETTTALPTPPLLGTLPAMMEQMSTTSSMVMPEQNMQPMAVDQMVMMNATSNSTSARDYMNSSDFRVRQARHVTPANTETMSYHCYTLQLNSNNTINTQRGCARVLTAESVCGQLKMFANNETSINKCKYCSTNRCNGSSALGVSAIALLFALVANFLKNA